VNKNEIAVPDDYQKYHDMMPYRIFNILLVSSHYDYFTMEKDGMLEQRLLSEYQLHDISFAPRIRHVTTGEKALSLLRHHSFSVLFSSIKIPDTDISSFIKEVKRNHPALPLILLANITDDIEKWINEEDLKTTNNIFVWTGDPGLFFAISKFLEDSMNVDNDTRTGDVRVIIVVEDNPRYYSLFLPIIYSEVMKHNHALIEEGLNDSDRMRRMRSRPKILLAKNFEEALCLFNRYKNNILGVISDISFPLDGKLNESAGFILAEEIKSSYSHTPIILQSSESSNRERAEARGALFINKSSGTMLQELREFILEYFGFGDFIFRNQIGEEVARASSIKELEHILLIVPEESLIIHSQHNHFSHWLYARGEFVLANTIKPYKLSDFKSLDDLRKHLIVSIQRTRIKHQEGVISDFKRHTFDSNFSFLRLGGGSMGGKARSLAFINSLLASKAITQKFNDVTISVPESLTIASDVFDEFLDENNLRENALNNKSDIEIRNLFQNSKLPASLTGDLKKFLQHIKSPLAVRSSSLFEDSHDQPFAGLYDTFMLPNRHSKNKIRIDALCSAIKNIYASTFFNEAKIYFKNTSFRLEEEKMSIVIQKLVGKTHDKYFYPDFSGVAQSHNYYPIGHMKPEDGISNVVLGFGKAVVEGNPTLRFCPKYPEILPQFAKSTDKLKNSQKKFYALDLSVHSVELNARESNKRFPFLPVKEAEKHGTLNAIGSVYSPDDDMFYDGIFREGIRVVTFANILKNKIFPLADILNYLLKIISDSFGGPVEIEFAVNLKNNSGDISSFNILQARPFLARTEYESIDFDNIEDADILCKSTRALGNGRINDIKDIIYVDPEAFDKLKTAEIAQEIAALNEKLMHRSSPYLLIGIGRWGTADKSLGVPVTWAQISGAEAIIESTLKNFIVEPSNGTHFFHNITACKNAYIMINASESNDFIDWKWLNSQTPEEKRTYTRHLRFKSHLDIRINGHNSEALITKPVSPVKE